MANITKDHVDPYFAEIDMYLSELSDPQDDGHEEPFCENGWCTECPYYQTCLRLLDM